MGCSVGSFNCAVTLLGLVMTAMTGKILATTREQYITATTVVITKRPVLLLFLLGSVLRWTRLSLSRFCLLACKLPSRVTAVCNVLIYAITRRYVCATLTPGRLASD